MNRAPPVGKRAGATAVSRGPPWGPPGDPAGCGEVDRVRSLEGPSPKKRHGDPIGSPCRLTLLPQPQVFDQTAILIQITPFQVFEQSATATDHPEKSSPAVVVTLVIRKMVPKLVDPLGKQSDLNRGAAPVLLVELVFFNDRVLFFLRHGHGLTGASARVFAAGEANLCRRLFPKRVQALKSKPESAGGQGLSAHLAPESDDGSEKGASPASARMARASSTSFSICRTSVSTPLKGSTGRRCRIRSTRTSSP